MYGKQRRGFGSGFRWHRAMAGWNGRFSGEQHRYDKARAVGDKRPPNQPLNSAHAVQREEQHRAEDKARRSPRTERRIHRRIVVRAARAVQVRLGGARSTAGRKGLQHGRHRKERKIPAQQKEQPHRAQQRLRKDERFFVADAVGQRPARNLETENGQRQQRLERKHLPRRQAAPGTHQKRDRCKKDKTVAECLRTEQPFRFFCIRHQRIPHQ